MLMLAGLMGALMLGAFTTLSGDETAGDDENDEALGDEAELPVVAIETGLDDDIDDMPDEPLLPSGDSLIGTSDADVLTGSAGDDTLMGLAGDDMLFGGHGADLLRGGEGNDHLAGDDGSGYGPGGDDAIHGGAGDDSLAGQGGNDSLYGGAGNDTLVGGEGDDSLEGGPGDDQMDGAAGNDTLRAGPGGGDLSGGSGDDRLVGNHAPDRVWLHGGEGADTIDAGRGDWMEGGAGADVLRILSGSEDTVVADFDPREDELHLVIPDRPDWTPEVRVIAQAGGDGLLVLDGSVVARITGGAGLTAADIQIRFG